MLSIKNISFSYLDKATITNFSCQLEAGRFMAIIGESGCGKSTILKLIYGLHDVDNGQIFWNNHEVLGPKYHLIPGMEFMKFLTQDFDLMPYISVAENVGKYLSNIDKEMKQQRILELLKIVEMTEFAAVKAKFLSGGQMQRVALAQVLALEPQVLLFDEPFSHIDNFRKNSLRRNLFKYLREKNITTIIASHDAHDYFPFVDEIVVLKNGEEVAKGTPNSLFAHPTNYYVASLFGDVNVIESKYLTVESAENILVYPHQLKIVSHSKLKVVVTQNYFEGQNYLIEGQYDGGVLFFLNHKALKVKSKVFLAL